MDGETGRPTGVLRENAVKLLQRLMSEEGGREAKREQLRTCLGKLGSVGLVGVQGGNSMLYCVLTVGCQSPYLHAGRHSLVHSVNNSFRVVPEMRILCSISGPSAPVSHSRQ